MLIRKDAIHPPPIEMEEFLLNLVKKLIYYKLNKSQKFLGKLFSLVKSFPKVYASLRSSLDVQRPFKNTLASKLEPWTSSKPTSFLKKA